MSRKKKTILIASAVVLAVVALVGVSLWLRTRANEMLSRELRAEFEAWLASITRIPDSENGALCILDGLKLLEDFPVSVALAKKEFLEEDGREAKILRMYLARNEEALRLIEKGLEFDKWQYPVDYSKLFDEPEPRLHIIIKIYEEAAGAFAYKGDIAKLGGDNVEALTQYLKTMRLGTTLSSDRLMISRLIETGIYSLALPKLASLLSEKHLGEKDLTLTLGDLLKLYDSRGDIKSMVELEKQFLFRWIADGIDRGHSMEWFGGPAWGEQQRDRGLPAKYTYDFTSDIESLREFFDKYQQLNPGKYYAFPEKFKDVREPDKKKVVGVIELQPRLAESIIPSMARCPTKFAISEVFWRGAIVMTAVRLFEARNGRLPRNLDELGKLVPKELLSDPFSGKQLVYRLKGDDFCLYSAGLDGVDSKCEDSRELFQPRADEGEPDDIIFHAPRPQRALPREDTEVKRKKRRKY